MRNIWKSVRILLLWVMLVVTGCSRDSVRCERDEAIDDEREAALASGATFVSREELEVYAAFLQSRRTKSAQFPLIALRTENLPRGPGSSVLKPHFVSLRSETFEALEEMSDTAGVLDDWLHEALGVCLISSTTLRATFDAMDRDNPPMDGDNPFVALIRTRGQMHFTRVGISSDGQQALFFMSFLRGGRSGYAAFILMERGYWGRWILAGENVIYEY